MATARGVSSNCFPARSRHWWAPGHRQVWKLKGRVGAGLELSTDFWLHVVPSGLFQLLVNPMNIYEEQKVVALYCLAS